MQRRYCCKLNLFERSNNYKTSACSEVVELLKRNLRSKTPMQTVGVKPAVFLYFPRLSVRSNVHFLKIAVSESFTKFNFFIAYSQTK